METVSTGNFQTFEQDKQQVNNYADFGSRLLAYLLDGFFLTTIFISIFFALLMVGVVGFSLSDLQNIDNNPAIILALISTMFLLIIIGVIGGWLYNALLLSSDKQATWGKQILGIKVTDLNGGKISFAKATGRYFATIITNIIPFFIGYLLAIFTDKKQTLHDMIASTLVISKK